jgi:hypothetical protein
VPGSPGDAIAYAYELMNPYHPECGVSGTLVLDQPLRVGERLTRAFANPEQNAVTGEITIRSGPEQDWEVVAIEPTERDGRSAAIRGYRVGKSKLPAIMQGRLILRRLG